MFLLAPAFSSFAAADVIFIAAAMTLDTIVELPDAFFDVLPANVLVIPPFLAAVRSGVS